VLAQFAKENPEYVRIIYRHFPLDGHPLSMTASQASEAAGVQGKFWEMHDLIFENQSVWSSMQTTDQFRTWLDTQAQSLGLDVEKFKKDFDNPDLIKKITDQRDGIGNTGLIQGTPSLYLNDLPYGGRNDLESLRGLVTLFKMQDNALSCPPMTIDPQRGYTANVSTSKGDIVIELYPDKAPLTVNSFVYLARKGWFNNVPFHRVLPDFVAQTGDPSGTGLGGPGYQYGLEILPDLKFDKPGVVGMAHAKDPNTNSSQFFITFLASPNLDGQYTIFGQVTQGMDVVKKLTPRNPAQDQVLATPDTIKSITIVEK
jgi:cyclophilin family peptidyl-prolyl cis-trans isomerase